MDNMQESMDVILSQLKLELRRGTQVLSVLSQMEEPMYGYSLVEQLKEKGVEIEPGTLYPMLRRLEKQGLLVSEWETGGSKPRKYYLRSEMGNEVYRLLCQEFREMCALFDKLIGKGEES